MFLVKTFWLCEKPKGRKEKRVGLQRTRSGRLRGRLRFRLLPMWGAAGVSSSFFGTVNIGASLCTGVTPKIRAKSGDHRGGSYYRGVSFCNIYHLRGSTMSRLSQFFWYRNAEVVPSAEDRRTYYDSLEITPDIKILRREYRLSLRKIAKSERQTRIFQVWSEVWYDKDWSEIKIWDTCGTTSKRDWGMDRDG